MLQLRPARRSKGIFLPLGFRSLAHFVSHQAQYSKWIFLPHLAAQRNKTAFVHKKTAKKAHAERQKEREMELLTFCLMIVGE
jgi:hypothetical protein